MPSKPDWLIFAGLTLLAFIANGIGLSSTFMIDPMRLMSGLAQAIRFGWLSGPPGWVDPSVGMITQPMGYLAADQWMHGHVPWWNGYGGVGMPLAAEMQTPALFLPFVFLLHVNNGWLWLRAVLQALSGIFTYVLLANLGLRRQAACLGGALFSLSAVFLLTASGPSAPVPFLPLLLIGVEAAAAAAAARRRMGWSLVTVSVAYSIYAGFPEVAFLNGFLAATWCLWRMTTLPTQAWRPFLGKLSMALGIAVCLSMPAIGPFLQYLKLGDLGPHNGSFMIDRLPLTAMPLQILPHLYGDIFGPAPPPLFAEFAGDWARVPGTISLAILTLALAALWRRGSLTGLRVALVSYIVVWEARYGGVAPVMHVMNLVPFLGEADNVRYSGQSVGLAVFVLAALGYDDYCRLPPLTWRQGGGVLLSLLAVLAAALLPNWSFIALWYRLAPADLHKALWYMSIDVFVLALLCKELRWPQFRLWLTGAVVLPSFLVFVLPQLAGLREGRFDRAPIEFLRQNVGTDRIMSLGPFNFNMSAAYGIASINAASLPIPSNWTRFVRRRLYPQADVYDSNGYSAEQQAALLADLPDYEAIGVRYVVAPPGQDLQAAWLAQPGKRLPQDAPAPVFKDSQAWIFALPRVAAYAEAADSGCKIDIISRVEIHSTCQRDDILLRHELFFPGWSATINRKPAAIGASGIFQTLRLPAGHATLRFTFVPTNMRLDCGIALLGFVTWICLAGFAERERRRKPAGQVPSKV